MKSQYEGGCIKKLGSKAALAALPLALGSLFNKAYGKTTAPAG